MVDGSEFVRLLVRYDRVLFRYIRSAIPDWDDAEEVLQQTAATLWEKFPEYDAQRGFLSWAMGITHFEVLNYRREFARNRLVFGDELLELLAVVHHEQSSMLEAQRAALDECLQHVDSEGLQLLRRRYCDSKSVGALADELGKTAKSLYRRLDRLRIMIEKCVEGRMRNEFAG